VDNAQEENKMDIDDGNESDQWTIEMAESLVNQA
jgi:hypothetical protein